MIQLLVHARCEATDIAAPGVLPGFAAMRKFDGVCNYGIYIYYIYVIYIN